MTTYKGKAMTQNYIIVKQETMNSKYGGEIIKITLVGTRDRFEYTTYIDPRNRNATNWFHIINHPTRGYVVSGIKTKQSKDGKLLVNADSDPIISAECEHSSELFCELIAVWREQDEKTPNQFRNLFE
jgi:hypothetical protein